MTFFHQRDVVFQVIVFLLVCIPAQSIAKPLHFSSPEAVKIEGLPELAGSILSTEEPFLSRDGRYLFFNSSSRVGAKDLYIASRVQDSWKFLGALPESVNDPKEVQGAFTMDSRGRAYYIDSGYPSMVRQGRFNTSRASLEAVKTVSTLPERSLHLFSQYVDGTMDVEVDAEGSVMILSRARWKLSGFRVSRILTANLWYLHGSGDRFSYNETQSAEIFKRINTEDLEYAASISNDKLTLLFTRLSARSVKNGKPRSWLMYAQRKAEGLPFEAPEIIKETSSHAFVEGAAFSHDETEIYYHVVEGGRSALYKVKRVSVPGEE